MSDATGERRAAPRDRAACSFVAAVWLISMAAIAVAFLRHTSNVPQTEDWDLVAALTGHESDLPGWLWRQNNEHRVPLPRLVLLGLLWGTGGDFRVGMIADVLMLGALTIAMLATARRLRGGRTRAADAFFPLALLHLGHWENFFWSWQLTFVLSIVLLCAVLLAFVVDPALRSRGGATAAGVGLVLLPLCGATGLIFVPALAPWVAYRGLRLRRRRDSHRTRGTALLAAALGAVGLSAVYFVGYERPPWTPPNPGLGPSIETALQFLALGFGPAARRLWEASTAAILVLGAIAGWLTLRAALRERGARRQHALALLSVFAALALFAGAMGWGRAAVIAVYGSWPLRYCLLAAPVLCATYFACELFAPRTLRTLVQNGMALIAAALLPMNTVHGLTWGHWYLPHALATLDTIAAGTTARELAATHGHFLYRSMPADELAELIGMLRDANFEPFAALHPDQTERTHPDTGDANPAPPAPLVEDRTDEPPAAALVDVRFVYVLPEAGTVDLAWGLDGWHAAPPGLRPPGTTVAGSGVLRTPMDRSETAFTLGLRVPVGHTVDYGFLITSRRGPLDLLGPLWDGDPADRVVVGAERTVERRAHVVLDSDAAELRRQAPVFAAGLVLLGFFWIGIFLGLGRMLPWGDPRGSVRPGP